MWQIALPALANIAGGIVGDQMSRGDRDKANNELNSIADLYNAINLPDIEKLKMDAEEYQRGEQLTPSIREQQIRELAMQDQLQNINLDPRLRQTQMNALETLSKIAGSGFTPDELNALQQQRDARESDLTSKLKQLQQQQEMRGVGNSDMALAQRMMEAQGSANRGAQEARDMQAQAFRRSLDAISQGANLAGNIEGVDYARGANLAQALRNRELTNLQNRINTEASNVDRFNRALEADVSRGNAILDKNVGIRNEEQMFNKNLLVDDYNRRLDRAGIQAGIKRDKAGRLMDQANRTATRWTQGASGLTSGLLAGLGGAGKTTASAQAADAVSSQVEPKKTLGNRFNQYGTDEF